MKKIILIAILFLSATTVKADEEQLEQPRDVCSEGVFYNPSAQDIVEAAQIFNLHVISSTCALRELVKAKKDIYLRVNGFQDLQNGYKVSYTVSDYSKYPKITDKDCTTTSRFVHPPDEMWDVMREVYSKPVCGPDIITQNIDPKTGKVTSYPR
jgi:hypothetical protein